MSKRSQGSLQKHEEIENLKNGQRVLEIEKKVFVLLLFSCLGSPLQHKLWNNGAQKSLKEKKDTRTQ